MMAQAPDAVVRRYEMGLTRAEFLRLLPAALEGDWHAMAGGAQGSWKGIEYAVRFVERPERRIAQMAVPVLDVLLSFAAGPPETIDAFVARFLRAYQRAGG